MLKHIYDPILLHYGANGMSKTQTRLPVIARLYNHDMRTAPIPSEAKFVGIKNGMYVWETETSIYSIAPPYKAGDILYVKESVKRICATKTTWFSGEPVSTEDFFGWKYKATGEVKFDEEFAVGGDEFYTVDVSEEANWKRAVLMPPEAAKTHLRVTQVQVEHLHDIHPADIVQEGILCSHESSYKQFESIWNSRFRSRSYDVSWNINPWVWKIVYEKVDNI